MSQTIHEAEKEWETSKNFWNVHLVQYRDYPLKLSLIWFLSWLIKIFLKIWFKTWTLVHKCSENINWSPKAAKEINTNKKQWTCFTCECTGLVLLCLGGRDEVLRTNGWHFVTSLTCIFFSVSVCKALCNMLKSGTSWMIFGWKLGFSSKNLSFSFLVRSAVRSFGPFRVGFSSLAVAWEWTFLQTSSWSK